jgi:hypothetical protein
MDGRTAILDTTASCRTMSVPDGTKQVETRLQIAFAYTPETSSHLGSERPCASISVVVKIA